MTTNYINGKKDPWIFILISLMLQCKISATTPTDCEYNGDMCALDPNVCFKPSMASYEMDECNAYTLRYGPGEIYESRGDIEFWIEIVHDRELYAENMRYRIMSYFQSPENNLTSIDGCCSLSPTDTCTLPALKDGGESQFAIIPMQDGSYCQYHFLESPDNIEWCTDGDSNSTLCKEFVDGKLILRSVFIALSLDSYSPIADYCFFEVPSTHYDANHTETYDNGMTRSIKNVTMLTKEGKVKVNYSVVDCDHNSVYSKQGVDVHKVFSRYTRSVDKIPCVMSRTRNDERWDESPTCAIPIKENPGQRTWVSIIIVVCLGIIVLLVVILLLWIYKNHVKTCFPDYDDTIKEMPDRHKKVLQENTDEEQNFMLNDKNGNKMSKTTNEKPDEIFRIHEQKSAEVSPLKKDKENLEISYLIKGKNVDNTRKQEAKENENPCENEDDNSGAIKLSPSKLENTNSNNPEKNRKNTPEEFRIINENNLSVPEVVSPGPDSGFSQTSFISTANSLPDSNYETTPTDVESKYNSPDSPIFDYKTDIPGVNANDGYMEKSAVSSGAYTPKFRTHIEVASEKFSYVPKTRKSSSSSGCGSADEETLQNNTSVVHNGKVDVIPTKGKTKMPNYIKQYSPSDEDTLQDKGPFILTVSDGYTPKDMI
ncbi:uncharacterized protein LOC120331655 [Styela clava]